MKNVLSLFISGVMVIAPACSVTKKNSNKPQPTQPATKEKISETENNMNDASAQNPQTAQLPLKAGAFDATINAMLKASDLSIKDYAGNDVGIEQYKLNPTQYFLLYKDKSQPNGYRAVKTSSANALALTASDKISLSFEVFSVNGEMSGFKGENLGAPKLSESLNLSTNPALMLQNKTEIENMIKRLESVQIASSSSALKNISNFLFPTAYAATSYKTNLMITAIVFSSVAVISYLFSWYTLGTITIAVGIVFWLLYGFEELKEEG